MHIQSQKESCANDGESTKTMEAVADPLPKYLLLCSPV